MGISGFIQTVKSVHEPMHINEYAGKTVAVDGNVWLHKGAFSCSRELALQEETTRYVDYFMRQVSLLEFNKVIPYIVFDGEPLPIKSATVQERRRRRTEALTKGKELLKQGKSQEATECFQQSIHVTPHMIKQVIKALKAKKIQHVIAPYEADAQLTYLMNTNKVDAVITEDSDLLVFGCHTVIFKMNQYGEGIRIQQKNLSTTKEIDLQGWDQTKIRHMCILSGCDYLGSLPGIGLKSAHKLLVKFRTIDSVLRHLRFQGKMKLAPDYEYHFKRADYAFLYQYVYDADVKKCVTLHTLPAGVQPEKLDYLGDNSNNNNSTTASSGANLQPTTHDQVKFYSLSNKENIPPWAHFDNKPSPTPSQHKPEASQPGINGGLRSVTNVLQPIRTEKRSSLTSLSQSKLQHHSSITAKELFKVFNHPQKQPPATTTTTTTKIRTHADIASAFQRQRFKNASSPTLTTSTSTSSCSLNTLSENHSSENQPIISTTTKSTRMTKSNTFMNSLSKREADRPIPDEKSIKRRTVLKPALSNISNTTSSSTTFV
ncbi:PIN domain-like protein [Phascolomyces articulosus]|uniref:Exonuclease 1 n=1 Tax=Phascolomyces articulosus TaxID=60185 RepID=A0AAD5KCM9_9FUNG|nr:PIN domain-like protein [Phascolomyces articulosus]